MGVLIEYWRECLVFLVALAFYVQSGRLLAMIWAGSWRF